MALIKCGNEIVEITGKLAGNIYKQDSSGQHIQAHGRKVRSNPTAGQRLQRNSWRTCYIYWMETSSDANRQLWAQYATLHPITNKQGGAIVLNAYQSFLSINMIRVHNKLDILASPPE